MSLAMRQRSVHVEAASADVLSHQWCDFALSGAWLHYNRQLIRQADIAQFDEPEGNS
jgi:hypothetical protein